MRVSVKFNRGPIQVYHYGARGFLKISVWVFRRHKVYVETLSVTFGPTWKNEFTWDGFLRDIWDTQPVAAGSIAIGKWVFVAEVSCDT